MASSSSSVSHSVPKKYDVFISFRGEDTRVGFTSHLRKALLDKGIDTYTDNMIQKALEVGAELVKAMKDSTIFLVIFSENYASSSWCLNELVEIMECMKQEQHHVHVIPVFYKVDPSHVRKQSGSYDIAFAKHKSDGKVSEDKMQQWKDTLFHAANLSGFHSHSYRTETDLIEAIIKAVLEKLNHKYTSTFTSHFIYDENYTKIESLLKMNSKEVRVIGIWGMGGIGKTSLATHIFRNVSSQYEGTCFLANVAEESKRHGLNYLWQKLLSDLLGEDVHIDTTDMIPYTVGRRLMRKKVLIVLDDVNTSRHLLKLIGEYHGFLGAGSRIIVTTRDKQVLISGDVEKIHEVKQMNSQNSLKLFSLKAFHKTYPEKGYEGLSKRATDYAKGIPLALEVLGSFLHSKREKHEWDSALLKLEKIPNGEIQEVLKLSFDGLDPCEKKIFLDLACFYKGQERDHVTKILNACNFFADIGIARLLEKALITTHSYKNHIEMHNLIQEMGREIVRQESPENPGKRSRLWDPEDVYDVLTNNKGTDAVEGIWLDMTQIAHIKISSNAFRKMPNLRLLVLKGECGKYNSIYSPKGLEFLPKMLRYFGWDGYPLESLPSTFCPENLVVLRMQHSNVKKLWQGVQNLPNLEKFNLFGCKHLLECPNLSGAPKLKLVSLRRCESLSSVDPSILSLPKLETLDLAKCTWLKTLNSNICSQSLVGLYLRLSGLNELPPSILHMRNLKTFSFSISYALVNLPENFARNILLSESREYKDDSFFILQKALPSPGFRSLTWLVLDECESLFEIPDNISLLSSMRYLTLYDCGIISLPESIKHLPKLLHLEVNECKKLQCIPELPPSIRHLYVWRCQALQTVLCSIIESSKSYERVFLFPNCLKLDEHSYEAILKGAIVMIELGAKSPPSPQVLENEQDASMYNCWHESEKICYSLPARNGKVLDWFHCHYTDASVPIEQLLPANLLGFIFYLVVSPVKSRHSGCCASIGCECYLETNKGERINITSFFFDKRTMLTHPEPFEFMKDHVFFWYDGKLCKQIREVIKERKASNSGDQKLTFKFFTQKLYNNEAQIIKECGFRWICSSKRSREGSESNDGQEETLPPTKKFKSGTSNLEAEETEELRRRLQELLLHRI